MPVLQTKEKDHASEQALPPHLGQVVRALRGHAPALADRGVSGLWVFGSVARGDARPGSDVDLFAELHSSASLSLASLSFVGLASLRAELSDVLGASADLVERSALHGAIREVAERDAVRIL